MTRDIQTLDTDDLNSNNTNDAAMYAALWAAAPFPRLPEDAPAEIKALTVEINDPRRVYTIHRAARRHEFQLLVERLGNVPSIPCLILMPFPGSSSRSDMAVSLKPVTRGHAFPIESTRRAALQCDDTTLQAQGHWLCIWRHRTILSRRFV